MTDKKGKAGRDEALGGSAHAPIRSPQTPKPPGISEAYLKGWEAGVLAARRWHEGKAKQALVQAGRNRFPKRFEQEAEVHSRSAEDLATLSPDDL